MKKQNTSEFEDTYSQSQLNSLANWEKVQAEGKWLWIFKRGAVWATMILCFYGLGAIAFPSLFNFQITQFYILFGMFGAFIFSSIIEWSKMENLSQQAKISKR